MSRSDIQHRQRDYLCNREVVIVVFVVTVVFVVCVVPVVCVVSLVSVAFVVSVVCIVFVVFQNKNCCRPKSI